MCLKMSAQITTYNINKNFNCSDTLQPFGIQTHSYGLSIDGEGQLLSDTAFIRVVLVDDNENEWLVYERNSLYSTEKNSQFQGAAFETAALYKIVPCSLIVTLCDAAFYLANIKNNCTYTNKNEVTSVSDSVFLSLPVLPQPRTRPNPPAILARREAHPSRALRPARPLGAHTEQGHGKHQPARPRAGAISYEGHYGGWEDLFGQGGERINTNILSPPTPYLPAVRYTLSCGEIWGLR